MTFFQMQSLCRPFTSAASPLSVVDGLNLDSFDLSSVDHLLMSPPPQPFQPFPAAEAPTLQLHQLFSSNMVLQRGPRHANVWGQGVTGSSVTVSVEGETVGSAVVDDSGVLECGVDSTAPSAEYHRGSD